MRLVRLEARDFAQHAELDLDLSTVSQAAILGENGAGKSKLMDAALWSLYGRATRGATDSLIRDGQQSMWVRTTWDNEGTEIVVRRTRSVETKAGESALSLERDGARDTRHTIAETQAVIEEVVGLTRDELLAGPWMAQGEQAVLMSLRPAQRTELAISLFRLDRFTPWYERTGQMLATVERELAVLDGRRQQLEGVAAMLPDRRAVADELRVALAAATALLAERQARVEALVARGQDLRAAADRSVALSLQIAALTTSAQTAETAAEAAARRTAEADRIIATAIPPEPVAPESSAALLAEVARWQDAFTAHAAAVAAIVHQGHAIAEAQMKLSRQSRLCDVCPYREDVVDPVALAAELELMTRRRDGAAAVMAEFADSRERLASNAKERAEWVAATRERDRLVAAAATAKDARAGYEEEHGTFIHQAHEARTQAAARAAERAILLQAQDALAEVTAAYRDEAQALTRTGAERDRLTGQAGAADAAVAEAEAAGAAIPPLDVQILAGRARAAGLRVVAKMFQRTGLPTMILEAGLPLIEGRANELLAKMPGEMSVRFRTQRQTKAGTWSDELGIEVEEAGTTREYDVMSGAERFRLDLALRIAIGSVLAHRSGRKFETLWIDEGFAAQSRSAVGEVLEAIASVVDDFGLTLAVTHQEEVADRFPVKIEVVPLTDGTSEVRVA